jgi:hypothetical protein
VQVKVWFQNRRMKWRHAQQRAKAQAGQPNGDNDNDINVSVNDLSADKNSDGPKQLDLSCESDDAVQPCDVTPDEILDAPSPRYVIADDVEPDCQDDDVAVDLSRSRSLPSDDVRVLVMQQRVDDVEITHMGVTHEDSCSEIIESDNESIDV